MLDWRGLIGTALVHGAAIGVTPAIDWGWTTHCLCLPFGDVEPMTVVEVQPIRLALFPTPADGDQRRVLMVTAPCDDGLRDASAPTMLDDPVLPPLLGTAPFTACASIDTTGRVKAISVRNDGGRSRSGLRRIRGHVEGLRFAPALRDGRPIDSRIEVRLGA